MLVTSALLALPLLPILLTAAAPTAANNQLAKRDDNEPPPELRDLAVDTELARREEHPHIRIPEIHIPPPHPEFHHPEKREADASNVMLHPRKRWGGGGGWNNGCCQPTRGCCGW
jgi:hypothetical protein